VPRRSGTPPQVADFAAGRHRRRGSARRAASRPAGSRSA
jgi:hypothetical protein